MAATLDAKPFVRDGFVSGVSINNGVLTITFNTDAGQQPISVSLGDLFNADNYYTKDASDGKFVVKVNGKDLSTNDYTDAEKTKLKNLPTADGLTQQLSSKANASEVVKSISVNGTPQTKDSSGNVNIPVQAGGESIVFDTEGTPIIDSPLSPNADTVLGAASARWVKEIDNNVKAILAALAGIAFTSTKPTWEAVAKRKYNLTMTALTGCAGEVVSGDAGNGQVYEGGVRIKLTPTQASYAFTSVTVNGNSVSTTATGDADGSVYLDIVVNGNITVEATAVSGRAITFNGTGCTIGAAGGVTIGQALDTAITANEHFTLPQSISVKIGNTNVTHTYTPAQDGKTATLHIDANNITGDLTIVCTAVEDDHAVLNLTGVESNVAVMRDSENLLEQQTPPHVYAGETISILPVGNNKVSATVTIGSTTATLQGNTYDGFTYTIQQGDVSSSGTAIAITAEATALTDCSVTLPSTGSGIVSAVLTDLNGIAIQSPVTEGTGIKIVLTPDTDYVINNISIANMTEGAGYDVTDNNGVKTITIQHVTGDVIVTATASQPQKVTIQYNTDKWRKTPSVTQVNEGVETPIAIEPMDTFKLSEVKYTIDGGQEQTGTIVDNACTLVVTANTSLEIDTKSVMDVVLGKTISYDNVISTTRTAASNAGEGSLYVNSYIPVPTIHNGDTILYYHQFKATSPRASSGVATYPSIGGTHKQGRGCGGETYLSSTFQSKNDGHKFIRMAFRYSNSNTAQETPFGDRSFALNGVEYVTEQDVVDAINYKLSNS